MALIDSRAQTIDDVWSYPDPAGETRLQRNQVLPLDQLVALGAEPHGIRPIGVHTPAGTTAEQLSPYLGWLDLIAVEFPKFRDGRGFTLARTLRNKLGFKGDIRAVGHVLPDQFAALVQCGISSILLPTDHPPEQWRQTESPAARQHAGPLLQRLLRAQTTSTDQAET